jgi:hypothetical protein
MLSREQYKSNPNRIVNLSYLCHTRLSSGTSTPTASIGCHLISRGLAQSRFNLSCFASAGISVHMSTNGAACPLVSRTSQSVTTRVSSSRAALQPSIYTSISAPMTPGYRTIDRHRFRCRPSSVFSFGLPIQRRRGISIRRGRQFLVPKTVRLHSTKVTLVSGPGCRDRTSAGLYPLF